MIFKKNSRPDSNTSHCPYQTLWGRALSPEIQPCCWLCRCSYPRRSVGCCGWLTCCVHLPSCWTCTSLTVPVSVPSCTETHTHTHTKSQRSTSPVSKWGQTHTLPSVARMKVTTAPSHLQTYNFSTLDVNWSHEREAKCWKLDFEAISIHRKEHDKDSQRQ